MKLSKSRYVRALQCPKMLWMDEYMPEEKDEDPDLEAIFETGNEVGDLARKYFGEYSLVDFDRGLASMIAETREFMDSGAVNIAEASFSCDGLFCSVDILRRNPLGWDIVEVKSSTSVHDVYLDDMTFQTYVLRRAGLNVTGVYNMHLNSAYVRCGDLNLDGLFTVEDCTGKVSQRLPFVEGNISRIAAFLAQAGTDEPDCRIGVHCEQPYECGYMGYCRRFLPSPNVFDVRGRLSAKKKYQYFDEGLVTFGDLINAGCLTKKQLVQVETEEYCLPPSIDRAAIKACTDEFTYPLYYLDFETYQQAVPQYDGVSPFMQIPFQYSLHIQNEKGGPCIHREHLGAEGTDTRRALAEQLCADIPLDVCTLAYNMKFEKMVIKQLAGIFPDLSGHLMNIHDNMKDLMVPFEKGYYYCRAMQGSYSIKYVLPALCPDDPELDYHSLDEIHHGGEASSAFAALHTKSPEEIARTRANLLAYCGLDTLAMVKVLEKLYELID